MVTNAALTELFKDFVVEYGFADYGLPPGTFFKSYHTFLLFHQFLFLQHFFCSRLLLCSLV